MTEMERRQTCRILRHIEQMHMYLSELKDGMADPSEHWSCEAATIEHLAYELAVIQDIAKNTLAELR